MSNEICLMISVCVIAICCTTYKIIKEIYQGNKVKEAINDIDRLKDKLNDFEDKLDDLEERHTLNEVKDND